ncbi:multicopper oxidase domain-containing protein (plasmid) [Deinococcus radiomollis]|uniref:multicopper oxidase domain-containing protein n=1 Tax=Deinococcus radiomollis TaxID=468916 RepID=UPI0038919911
MHLHGYTFRIVARDGNTLAQPENANTVMLGASQTADIEFVASTPGTWMLHCHIMDHTVNPGPGSEGSATHEAEMGGLVTFIRVVPQGRVQTMPARDLMTMAKGM